LRTIFKAVFMSFFVCMMIFGCGKSPSSTGKGEPGLPPGIDMALSGEVNFVEFEGKEKVWSLVGGEATYSTEAGVLNLKDVEAHYYKEGKPIYSVIAEKGRYNTKSRVLDVNNDVVATSVDGYILRTDSMRYSFREKVAITPSPLEIEGEGLRMSGVGMEALLDEEVVRIKKDVKVHVEPGVLRRRSEGGPR